MADTQWDLCDRWQQPQSPFCCCCCCFFLVDAADEDEEDEDCCCCCCCCCFWWCRWCCGFSLMATEDVDEAGKHRDGLVGLTVVVPKPAVFTCNGGGGLLFIFTLSTCTPSFYGRCCCLCCRWWWRQCCDYVFFSPGYTRTHKPTHTHTASQPGKDTQSGRASELSLGSGGR